jgi:MacB-like periplasmic core domain
LRDNHPTASCCDPNVGGISQPIQLLRGGVLPLNGARVTGSEFAIGKVMENVTSRDGRGFERTDNVSQGKVAIVNETLAKRIWKGQNPIGQRLRPPGGSFGASDDVWHTVIGVAKDVRQRGVERPAGTELYVSLDQNRVSPPSMNVVMRTTLPRAALSRTIERVVSEVDAAVPVVRLRDMDSVFAESTRRPRLLAQLLGAFAALSLLLAASARTVYPPTW